jgi:hypothetical protein
MARPAAASTAAAAPAASPGSSPREIAAQALLAAASGDVNGALRYFTAANFPKEKQEDSVREAYFELRLQRLVSAATARQCAGMKENVERLGDEDKALPFTFNGFGGFLKGARVQYLLGLVEFTCIDEGTGRKRWESVAKATAGMSSPDYAYAVLAMNRLSEDDGRGRARTSINFMRRQIDNAPAAAKGTMLFNLGQLQLILGRKEEAMTSFRSGAEAGPAGMVEYLNRDAIRTIDSSR